MRPEDLKSEMLRSLQLLEQQTDISTLSNFRTFQAWDLRIRNVQMVKVVQIIYKLKHFSI